MSYLRVKYVIDILLSAVALLVIWPILLFIAILIKLETPGPILFKQKRIGIHKTEFYIIKFRTMKIDTPRNTPTHLLENPQQYITKMGMILRKTSLDELPQLMNVIKGEMSLIGPRPALWNQYDLIENRDKYQANDVRPGLTGWAQVNGRDQLSINSKAELDGEYVKRISFFLDCKCFFMTINSVIRHRGIIEGNTSTLKQQDNEEIVIR